MADVSRAKKRLPIDWLECFRTHDLQLRLIIPTTRPVGCLAEACIFASFDCSTCRSARTSSSSLSSSDSSASSFFKVAAYERAGKRQSWACRDIFTFLVNNLVRGRFPLLLVENFDRNDITLHRTVHVLSTNQENGFVKS